jgi:ribosomal protein S3
LGFQGFQLRINGKLNGKMRKSKYHYSLGKVPLQTLQILLSYSLTIAYTRFGVITTKISVIHDTKKI